MKHSLLIAIENYLDDKKISKVLFAENDLSELKEAIKNIGYKSDDCQSLLNANATKTRIELALDQLCNRAKKEDEIIFYYAGHGFADNGNNYITCYDTLVSATKLTSISIQTIFEKLRAACDHVIFFFDSCNSGMLIDSNMRGLYSSLNDREFEEALKGVSYCVGFSACKANESSLSITKYKHGAWTYHLIECLNGRVLEALEKNRFLTARSLQDYLHKAVPESIRQYYTDTSITQTPWTFGGNETEFIIGDLENLLKKKLNPTSNIKEVILSEVCRGNIKDLSNFRMGKYSVPTSFSPSAKRFVCQMSQTDLNEEADRIHQILHKALGYKLKDIEKNEGDYGFAYSTPNFSISVTIEQDEKKCTQYKQTTEIAEISDFNFIKTPNFSDVFANSFNTLTLILDKEIDTNGIVAQIENIESEEIDVDKGENISEYNLKIKGVEGTMSIRNRVVSVKFDSSTSPENMARSLTEMLKRLKDLGNIQLLME